MARRALLIGSPMGGLTGPMPDVFRMKKALEARGFEITLCGDGDATRAGILGSCEALIAKASSDAAALVYYPGHGGRGRLRGGRDYQYIVPMDFERSASGYRGIVSLELSAMLKRLTDKTRNVTVVLDCCHSAHMTREAM